MIAEKEFNTTCVMCGVVSVHQNQWRKIPVVDEAACGLDGRPSYDVIANGATRLESDAQWVDYANRIITCPSCGHFAPKLDEAYPELATSRAARETLLAMPAHDERARRYLAVAQLFGRTKLAEEARWILRAAWSDEAAGRSDGARSLRLRAAKALEEVLCGGSALSHVAGHSSVILAELYRAAGQREKTAEHILRGLGTRASELVRAFLVVETDLLLDHRDEPITRGEARARFAMMKPEERTEAVKVLRGAVPAPPPITLSGHRGGRYVEYDGDVADRVFTIDYLTEGRVAEFLAAGMEGVARVAFDSPVMFAELFCALDHSDTAVRARAFRTLHNTQPPSHPLPRAAIDAILRRLHDDDVTTVRAAGALLRHVVGPNPEHRAHIFDAIQALLPKWSHDIATEGVLERVIGKTTPPLHERRPRLSYDALKLWASLEPCPGCRRRTDPGGGIYTFDTFELFQRVMWSCGECKLTRFLFCPTTENANSVVDDGPWPMPVFELDALIAELERRRAHVRDEPQELAPLEWDVRRYQLEWAIKMVAVVLEQLPEGRTDLAWSRASLESERDRLVAIETLFTADAPRIGRLEKREKRLPLLPPYKESCGVRGELRPLLENAFGRRGFPTAADLRDPFLPKAVAIHGDVIELGTDVRSIRIFDDEHGRARIELVLSHGALADVEAVFGPEGRVINFKRAAIATITHGDGERVERLEIAFQPCE